MKEYKIFSEIGELIPKEFKDVFYSEHHHSFIKIACTLIIDGESYSVQGEDKKIINLLEERLKLDSCLYLPTYGTDGNIRWDGIRYVEFDDKDFGKAVNYFAYENDYVYLLPNYRITKVNSPAEAEYVKAGYEREYQRKVAEAQQSQQRKAA